jgi:Protein of unknown function (DUF4229)
MDNDLDGEMPVPTHAPDPLEAADSAAAALHARQSHAILRYTTLRLALFFLAIAVVWLVRVRSPVLLIAIALVLSGLASFVLLGGQRDAMSAQLHQAQHKRRERAAARAAREDAFQGAGEGDQAAAGQTVDVCDADDRTGGSVR